MKNINPTMVEFCEFLNQTHMPLNVCFDYMGYQGFKLYKIHYKILVRLMKVQSRG